MQLNKSVNIGVGYVSTKPYEYKGVKFESDVKDGDVITILDSGQEVISTKFGNKTQLLFKVKTRNGEKGLNLNKISMNNLIDGFGGNTEKWVGKEIQAWVIKAMISGEMKKVCYVAPIGFVMDEDTGNFSNPNQVNASDDIGDIDFDPTDYPTEDEIDLD